MRTTKMYVKVAVLLAVLTFASCSKDEPVVKETPEKEVKKPNPEPKPKPKPKGAYEKGFFVSGEGSGANSGSITHISEDLYKVEQKIFKKVNKKELGTYLQSITFNSDRGYIIVDDANTITVVNRYTFKKEGKITSKLLTPRYMAVIGDKGYVTNWGKKNDPKDDFVSVVNLKTLAVEKNIPVALGPERIISKNNKLFVSHKGAYGSNNIVSVIDAKTQKVVKQITVNDNPDEMFFNSLGKLVVLSEGKVIYDKNWKPIGQTKAAISFINPQTYKVENKIDFPDKVRPSLMTINNKNIYYVVGKDLFKVSENTTTLSATPYLKTTATYLYGVGIKDDNLFIVDGTNFKTSGKTFVYDLKTKKLKKEVKVGLGASKIYFN